MPIQSRNPYTNKVENTFEEFSSEKIDALIKNANTTFSTWKNTSFTERKKLMLQLSELLYNAPKEITELPTLEMGRLLSETIGWELPNCADIAVFYAKNAEKFMKPNTIKSSMLSGSTVIQKEPLGVLFGIMPWNYPFYQVLRFAIPNIMAGNTVIIKHASNVPKCAIAIENLFKKAGFPEGVYTNVLVSGRNTSQIISDNRIKGISLTGSESAGSKVAELAGKHLKKVVLELGGSDPFILLDDADIDYATDLAVMGRFFNSGQTCIASKRFIIHQSIYNDFLEKFIAKTTDLKAGNPLNASTNFAPMSSQKEVDNLIDLIEDAVSKGAKIELGGKRIENLDGAWLEPTIISNVSEDMDIFHKELFGPVAVVYKVKNDDKAIALANNSAYGLSSVIVGKNDKRIDNIANQLDSGMVFKNTISITEPDLPFGGIKNSGFGRELGSYGMEEFVNHKIIRKVPVWAFKTTLKK
ncbi:NAD-dependent succinate-semialdehyde dehydrogenase [Psychroserpens sp. MEBiC05023]